MRLRKFIAPVAAAVVAAAALVTANVADQSSKPGVFYSICDYRDSKKDDPIVFPMEPGASHMHDFAGREINAGSVPSSARGQDTTCDVIGDSAGYWVPSLYVDGVAHSPVVIQSRYSAGGKPVATLQPFPAGLQVVAGFNTKYAKPGCRPGTSKTAPLGCKKQASMVVTFPDCWDGKQLRSPDGKNPTHMAYSKSGACPALYPIPVPSITLKALYEDLPATGEVTLASGSVATMHADFFNSWDQDKLAELVETCIRQPVKRGQGCAARTSEPTS